MKTHFKKSEYVLAGVLALVAAFPFAVDPMTITSTGTYLDASVASVQSVQQKALANYQTYRDSRRDYQKAQALCTQLRAGGSTITCPDINDYNAIHVFLSTHSTAPAAATGSAVVIHSLTDLTPYQLNLMRRYQKINTCPDTMKGYLPGFFELCESLLNPNPVLYHGIVGPTGDNSATVYTLDDLIKANKGVKRTW